jgi:predicted ester cyclase
MVASPLETMTMADDATLKRNKAVVLRFNREVIERGDVAAFKEIMATDFVNRTAPPGMSTGPDGMLSTFNNVLRPAFPDLRVDVHDQIAEGDKVTTRKTIRGTHQGPLLGIAPTGKQVAIEVIDIIRLRDGQYVEHWGINTLSVVLTQLRS